MENIIRKKCYNVNNFQALYGGGSYIDLAKQTEIRTRTLTIGDRTNITPRGLL